MVSLSNKLGRTLLMKEVWKQLGNNNSIRGTTVGAAAEGRGTHFGNLWCRSMGMNVLSSKKKEEEQHHPNNCCSSSGDTGQEVERGLVLKVQSSGAEDLARKAAGILRSGGVIGVPTDTVYGIAADAQNKRAVERIYEIKGRDCNKPIAICVDSIDQVYLWGKVQVPRDLLEALLPGPVTLVFERQDILNRDLNPKTNLIGIRIPDNQFVVSLARYHEGPVALTSANRSAAQSTLEVKEFQNLWDSLDCVFDGGRLTSGEESENAARAGSTVIDLSRNGYFGIIRNGNSAVKANLIERLKECVKELQLKYTSEQWVPMRNEEATSMLCWILEAIFIHGLKNTFIKSLSAFTTRKDAVPNPSFWDFVMIFSHRDIIEQVRKLNYVNTDIGRCRAWIRFALNEMSLVSYLENMFRNPSYVRSFYKPAAFLRDTEKCDILKNYLVGIVESCKFDLVVDNSLLNQWNSGPLALVGLWVDDNVTQGVDVAQNMESKDLQAIPQLGKSKTPEPQIMNVLRRQPLLPEEDAFRIIMASKPSGSSGASSRRNSDSSSRSREIIASQVPGSTSSGLSRSFKETPLTRNAIVSSVVQKPSETVSKQIPISLVESEKTNPHVANELTCTDSVENVSHQEVQSQQTAEEQVKQSENPTINIEKSNEADQISEELSYIELLKTYNQEQMVGNAIYSGSPKPDDLFVREPSEETTSTSEVLAIQENEDGIEILTLRQDGLLIADLFSHIINYSKRIPAEMGMDTQNYSCKLCRKHIGMVVFPFRYCHFTGFNFCTDCHLDENSVIPSRVLLNWDFSRYSVSHQSLELLNEVKEHPVFDVNEINHKLYLHVEELSEIKRLRTKLNYVSLYLKTCKDPTIYHDFKKLATELSTPDHLYEHVHRYSISDLIAVTDGTLATSLSRLFTFGKYHTIRCNICKSKGFVCEICKHPEVIFPFNLESTYKCSLCGAVYHDKCMSCSKPCPRCERWNVYDTGIEDCDNDDEVTLSISSQVAYNSENVAENEHVVP